MNIIPYIGIDNIKFGMDENELEAIAGAPESVSRELGAGASSDVVEQIRKGARFQFGSGRLACVVLDSAALSKNRVCIGDRRLPPSLLDLVMALNSASASRVRIRNPAAYIYPELGAVIYFRKSFDIRMGKEQLTTSHALAVCSRAVFKDYLRYFWENLWEDENADAAVSDLLDTLIRKADDSEE